MLYIFLSIITHSNAIPSDNHYAKIGYGLIPGPGMGSVSPNPPVPYARCSSQ